jgi:hypothetical protein
MGHIRLATPVAHIWFLKSIPISLNPAFIPFKHSSLFIPVSTIKLRSGAQSHEVNPSFEGDNPPVQEHFGSIGCLPKSSINKIPPFAFTWKGAS